MMLITLDNLAHRYQCLPSEALGRANTFDLYVLDISTKWFKYQNDVANGKETNKSRPNLTVDQMQEMIRRARSEYGQV
jgi:hypothetical protein